MSYRPGILLSLFLISSVSVPVLAARSGSAVFIHPDGTGLGHWNAARHLYAGPDGMLNWDRMDRLAAYRVHQKNWLSTTSHAGATVHAYGKKVHYDSYGLDRDEPLTALSGKPMSIMEEAMQAGIRTGIVNSGHIGEPGTGVFLASSDKRGNVESIARQVLESGADLIFCGGEIYLLPEGVVGHHGKAGVRKDGRNLLKEAKERGYTVIYTRESLQRLDPETGKVIGIFAATDTYNDRTEDQLLEAGLETYDREAPTFDDMVETALEVLGSDPERQFFLVAEEEGTDNFSNKTNAKGMLDAMGRADRAIGKVMQFMEDKPSREILLMVGADSDAGHPGIWGPRNWTAAFILPMTSSTGAQMDGVNGTGGKPFWSQPDANGVRRPFGIAWAMSDDMPGSCVTKAHGFKSELLGPSIDNTGIYPILYEALFGRKP